MLENEQRAENLIFILIDVIPYHFFHNTNYPRYTTPFIGRKTCIGIGVRITCASFSNCHDEFLGIGLIDSTCQVLLLNGTLSFFLTYYNQFDWGEVLIMRCSLSPLEQGCCLSPVCSRTKKKQDSCLVTLISNLKSNKELSLKFIRQVKVLLFPL